MTQTRRSIPVDGIRVLGGVVAVGVFLGIVALVLTIAMSIWTAISHNPLEFTTTVLTDAPQTTLRGIDITALQVTTEIGTPSFADYLMWIYVDSYIWVIAVACGAMLAQVVRAVRRGTPFVASSIRPLRSAGLLLILVPFAGYVSQYFEAKLLESSGATGFSVAYSLVDGIGYAVLGLGLVVLAKVWAVGVKAQDDVAGLV